MPGTWSRLPRRIASRIVCAAVAVVGGCGDAAHVEISGKPSAEGAMLASEVICKNEVRCGTVEISCGGGTGMATLCSATIVHPAHDRCVADVKDGIERILSCAAITAAQVDMIEQCVDALGERRCVTQAEADAVARAAEMQMSVPPPPQPPECSFLRQPIPGCDQGQ